MNTLRRGRGRRRRRRRRLRDEPIPVLLLLFLILLLPLVVVGLSSSLLVDKSNSNNYHHHPSGRCNGSRQRSTRFQAALTIFWRSTTGTTITTGTNAWPLRFSVAPSQSPTTGGLLSDDVAMATPGDGEGAADAATPGPGGRFMYMTEEEDRILKEKGDVEASLMNRPEALKPFKVRAGNTGGGFGGGTAPKAGNGKKRGEARPSKADGGGGQQRADPATVHALVKTLETDGLVRIDNVMSAGAADALRDYLVDLRARATAAVEAGTVRDSQERFADVLLNQNRCDLKVPLGPAPINEALLDVLHGGEGTDGRSGTSIVRTVIEAVFDSYGGRGSCASLWELNCFMSNSGARRQLVHADNVCLEPVPGLDRDGKEPIILTCFVALQDVDASMGPTVWMPGTHTIDAHNRFFETGRDGPSTKTATHSPKNDVLSSSRAVVGAPLPRGSCVIFDPRVLHCAGENACADPNRTRAIFYMSFKNPKVDDPGCPSTSGYGVAAAELTMEELVSDLTMERQGRASPRLALLASSP